MIKLLSFLAAFTVYMIVKAAGLGFAFVVATSTDVPNESLFNTVQTLGWIAAVVAGVYAYRLTRARLTRA